jgi:3-oxoacyl-[acyl-carrier protein] reductase
MPGRQHAHQLAFIHGGSRGIGAATARRLARDGATVAIGYATSAIAAEALAEEIRAAGPSPYASAASTSSSTAPAC